MIVNHVGGTESPVETCGVSSIATVVVGVVTALDVALVLAFVALAVKVGVADFFAADFATVVAVFATVAVALLVAAIVSIFVGVLVAVLVATDLANVFVVVIVVFAALLVAVFVVVSVVVFVTVCSFLVMMKWYSSVKRKVAWKVRQASTGSHEMGRTGQSNSTVFGAGGGWGARAGMIISATPPAMNRNSERESILSS